jgi:hypothetical protein
MNFRLQMELGLFRVVFDTNKERHVKTRIRLWVSHLSMRTNTITQREI